MKAKKKFTVKAGDPFGGYAIYGENLTAKKAEKLKGELGEEVDYFTTVIIEQTKKR